MLFTFALECAIKGVQVNQNGCKLNAAHQLLFCADDVNILGGSVHTINKNTEASVAASKKNGLELIPIKLSIWSRLDIRIQDQNTI